ncbi:MAG: hypothetical protein AAGA96_17945 [Verrucomicrobiota bacterium]
MRRFSLSSWCLDTPLIALGWAILFGLESGSKLVISELGALSFGVWAVYLLDRLYDTREAVDPALEPRRHQMARNHRVSFQVLFTLSLVGFVFSLTNCRSERFWIWGSLLAGLTATYYLLFRFNVVRRMKKTGQPQVFPLKEGWIAVVFTCGVALVGGVPKFEMGIACVLVGFCLVSFSNCLMISSAETDYDAVHDPSAFFAGVARSKAWVAIPNAASVGAGVGSVLIGGHWIAGGILIVVASLLIRLASMSQSIKRNLQEKADAIFLVAWIGVAIHVLRGTQDWLHFLSR